jgi:hypothetical protein
MTQRQGSDVFCLKMRSGYEARYLVLRPVDWLKQTYRRVGLIKEDSRDKEKRENFVSETSSSGSKPKGSLRSLDEGGSTSFLGEGFGDFYGGSSYDSPWPSKKRRSRRLGDTALMFKGTFPDGDPIPEEGKGVVRMITIV